jgi:hypothetical protein
LESGARRFDDVRWRPEFSRSSLRRDMNLLAITGKAADAGGGKTQAPVTT